MTPKLFAALLTIALTGGTALAFWMAGPGPLQTPDVWVSGTGDCGPHSPCTRTIGNAIEMVDASGTVHVLPFNGTYRENIGIPKPLTLRGEDRAGVVLLGIVNGTVIDIASSGVTVENMTVFHVPSAVDTTGVGMTKKGNVVLRALTLLGFGVGIRATDMRALTIEASDVVLSGGNGIVVDASRDIMIAPGNRLLNNSGLGLAVNASRNVTIASNTFVGNRAGFNVSFSVNVTVEGNTISNNGAIIPVSPGPSPHPLCCDGGGGWFWQTDPTAVERNVITDNGDVGILIGGDRSTDFTLRDNVISGNRGHGVLLTSGASRIDVSSTISDNLVDGIRLDNVSAVTIHDSQLEGNGRFGVRGQFLQGIHVVNNVIGGNGRPSPVTRSSSGPSPLCCDGGGGWFWQTDPSEFRGNTVQGNDGAGITLIDSQDWDIAGNTFSGDAGPGTDLVRSENIHVTANAYADLAVGIRIEDGCHIFLEGNTFANVETPLETVGTPCDVEILGLATLRFMPETLNLNSQGRFVTIRFEVTGLDPSSFDVSSLAFDVNGVILTPPAGSPSSVQVHGDVIDAMVKLDRADVIAAFGTAGTYVVRLMGEVQPGVFWVASDTVRAILP